MQIYLEEDLVTTAETLDKANHDFLLEKPAELIFVSVFIRKKNDKLCILSK